VVKCADVAGRDSAALRAKITGLQEEKDRLSDKVRMSKEKFDRLEERMEYMECCNALRKTKDDEVMLSQQLQTQKSVLERAEATYARSSTRLRGGT
jgi:predicted nuclease with TOPRIM domain